MECKWQITNRHCFRLRHSLFPTIMRAPTVCVWRGLRLTIYLLPRRPHLRTRTAEMRFTRLHQPPRHATPFRTPWPPSLSSPFPSPPLPPCYHHRIRNPPPAVSPACRCKYTANILPSTPWKWSRSNGPYVICECIEIRPRLYFASDNFSTLLFPKYAWF